MALGAPPVSAQSSESSAPTVQSVTMGQLVQLTASGQLMHATLESALTHPEPGVRAVAARIVGVERILPHRAALAAGLARETDEHVIGEQVISLLTLGTSEA